MSGASKTESDIRRYFTEALKEYAAFDRTLDALASFSFILHEVKEIAQETEIVDFRPKTMPIDDNSDPYTPDGAILTKRCDFILELKSSWNDRDIPQVVKYGKSVGLILKDGGTRLFRPEKCVLLGYQNPPGEANLDALFASWKSNKLGLPLVVFRYSLESAAEGDRMYFGRVPYTSNGSCPSSKLGDVLNSPRGFPVSAERYKLF